MNLPYWLADLFDDGPDSVMAVILLVAVVTLLVLLFWPVRRCALCRVAHEELETSRFGKVCVKCKDAVFRMYHYRARLGYRPPTLTEEQARRILKNLFDGDGWRNG